MKCHRRILFSCLVLSLLVALPASARQGRDEAPDELLERLSAKQQRVLEQAEALQSLESFVEYGPGFTVSLDVDSARAAGFTEEILNLAQEMAVAQNEMLFGMREKKQRSVEGMGVDLPERKNLKQFLDTITAVEEVRSKGYLTPKFEAAIAGSHPCGNYAYPVPNATLAWFSMGLYTSRTAAASRLVQIGFHKTAGYVGTNDYTRGRSYSSIYGFCSSPRFRDHGLVNYVARGYDARVQYGECNPEVFSYGWPYWNWPSYCRWYHATH